MKAKKKISNGVKVGLIAITINIITVFVYIYQTNLMQKQQHASVWPYVEWKTIYNQIDGFKLQVSNNGIGPALINKVTFALADEVQSHLDTLLTNLIGTTKFPHLRSEIKKHVLPAGQSINIFETSDPTWAELLMIESEKKQFEMEICYESIYKDKWISRGTEVIESRCD